MSNKLILSIICLLATTALFAGNPDRQGEAGAYELLMNPWAKSAGLHTMTTSMVSGVEAMRLNIAGLSRINNTDIYAGNALYLRGTDIRMNSFGIAQRVGSREEGKGYGAFGLSLMALNFGDIPITTAAQPEGTGATFSPNFFHLGIGYSHTFANKVSVGILVRAISESTPELSAFGFGIDSGVQYVAGDKDNFKIGISLRNVGSPMSFSGQGLAITAPAPEGETSYALTLNQRSETFELPSVLNIGASYDFYLGENNRLTFVGNFTANSFSQDQIGGGLEFSLNDLFLLRAGYKYEVGSEVEATAPIYTGLSGGISVNVPLSKDNRNNRFGIDYAYRDTKLWDGTHNIGIRISL